MANDKFLIAPLDQGLQRNVKPWQAMENAFENLTNVYSWRGRIRKRPGSMAMNTNQEANVQQQFSRLRINIGTTAAVNGNFNSGAGPSLVPGSLPGNIGEMFSVGGTYFTIYQPNGATKTTGVATATYNTATKQLVITGNNENPTTAVYWYPALPVMNFVKYEQTAVNDEQTVAFDAQFSYKFTFSGGWNILGAVPPAAGSALWSGSNNDFYSTTNYRGANSYDYLLFVVNGITADGIKYWNGATWTTITPIYDSVNMFVIQTAKIVISFKDRLLLLNTVEQTAAGPVVNNTYRNRVRFSQNGSPLAADAWYEKAGKGGYIEAPTKEAIIGAKIIRDRLIIFFESSTYELIYTNNKILPFAFQLLDTNLGVESSDSLITFDRQILGFGSTGIHACNGVNVTRIDELIPNEIYEIENKNSGPERVCGIRDFDAEIVYWSYSSSKKLSAQAEIFPNKMLALNYISGAWAEFDDSITAFGYYQIESDIIIGNLSIAWEDAHFPWYDASLQSKFKTVIAGNQQGYTFLMNTDVSENANSLQITDIAIAGNVITLTIIDHNLIINDYILISNVVGTTGLNGNTFKVNDTPSTNTITIVSDNIANAYLGSGEVKRVSQISLKTKQFNFYTNQAASQYIPEINFLVKKTTYGEISTDFYTTFNDYKVNVNENNAQVGDSILTTYPDILNGLENTQDLIWRNFYPMVEGQTIQIELNMTDAQMLNKNIQNSAFELHGIILQAQKTIPF